MPAARPSCPCRNAYILVAIKGKNYCSSALHAVKLIVTNILRMAAVNTVGDFLIFLGKLAVTAGCGFIAFLISDIDYYNNPGAWRRDMGWGGRVPTPGWCGAPSKESTARSLGVHRAGSQGQLEDRAPMFSTLPSLSPPQLNTPRQP